MKSAGKALGNSLAKKAQSRLGAALGTVGGVVVNPNGRDNTGYGVFKNLSAARTTEESNRLTPAKASYIKAKWGKWLAYRPPNVVLLFTNILYIAVTLTALGLGLTILGEHADDFTRNSFEKWVGESEPTPCGMPTPDGMKLLEAFGAVGGGGFSSVTLDPDYQKWMLKIDRAICSKTIAGIDIRDDAYAGYINQYGALVANANELTALSYILNEPSILPNKEEVEAGELTTKAALFNTLACLTENQDDLEPFYPSQQMDSYGDLKIRIGRAYVAAMPAFARYEADKATCSEADGTKSPFDSFCKHATFIKAELTEAVKDAGEMLTGTRIESSNPNAAVKGSTTFVQMAYRLMALSVAGYHDRHLNEGRCFKNDEADSAMDFCHHVTNVLPNSALASHNDPDYPNGGLAAYSAQNTIVEERSTCIHDSGLPPPPPPTPPIFDISQSEKVVGYDVETNNAGIRAIPWVEACAATLRYGLYEQGRLFGIQDIFSPFVIDNRVDRTGHFLATWIYNALYVDAWNPKMPLRATDRIPPLA